MSLPYSERLSLLEHFRLAAWGKNPFIKESTRTDRTIKYLDFGEHLPAVQSFCDAVDDKLVVFNEYSTTMEEFEKQDVVYERGASIIGQPGIGKTCFIAYAVVVRLLKKQPVAIEVSWDQSQPEYLLFTSDTVTVHDSGEQAPLLRYPKIWAFSDSNADVLHPIITFRKTVPRITVFFTKPISMTNRQLLSVYVPTPWLADQLVKGPFRFDEDQRDIFSAS